MHLAFSSWQTHLVGKKKCLPENAWADPEIPCTKRKNIELFYSKKYWKTKTPFFFPEQDLPTYLLSEEVIYITTADSNT